MILFNPKPKRPRRAARSGSGTGHHPSQRSTPPIQVQSAPRLPPRPLPPDPPPYSLYPPERTPPVTVAPPSTTQPRPNANASRVTVNPVPAARDGLKQWQPKLPDVPHHRISLCDLISSKLDAIITSIDGEVFSGDERELGVWSMRMKLHEEVTK